MGFHAATPDREGAGRRRGRWPESGCGIVRAFKEADPGTVNRRENGRISTLEPVTLPAHRQDMAG